MNVEEQVKEVLNAYESAVNRSDLDAVVALFAKDGAVLAPGSPSAVGRDAVQDAYRGIFQAIQLNIKFQVAEIAEMSTAWAFARTHSTGSMLVHATGETCPNTTTNSSCSNGTPMGSSGSRAIASRKRRRHRVASTSNDTSLPATWTMASGLDLGDSGRTPPGLIAFTAML